MTHAEACHAAFDRAGLWHLVGEGRRLTHFLRTGRWCPPDAPEPITLSWRGYRFTASGQTVHYEPEWPTYG